MVASVDKALEGESEVRAWAMGAYGPVATIGDKAVPPIAVDHLQAFLYFVKDVLQQNDYSYKKVVDVRLFRKII